MYKFVSINSSNVKGKQYSNNLAEHKHRQHIYKINKLFALMFKEFWINNEGTSSASYFQARHQQTELNWCLNLATQTIPISARYSTVCNIPYMIFSGRFQLVIRSDRVDFIYTSRGSPSIFFLFFLPSETRTTTIYSFLLAPVSRRQCRRLSQDLQSLYSRVLSFSLFCYYYV